MPIAIALDKLQGIDPPFSHDTSIAALISVKYILSLERELQATHLHKIYRAAQYIDIYQVRFGIFSSMQLYNINNKNFTFYL